MTSHDELHGAVKNHGGLGDGVDDVSDPDGLCWRRRLGYPFRLRLLVVALTPLGKDRKAGESHRLGKHKVESRLVCICAGGGVCWTLEGYLT